MDISQKQDGPPPKSWFGCLDDDATHIPLASEKIIHIMRFSGKRRAGPQGGPQNGMREQEGATGLEFNVVRGQGWGEGSHM